MTNKYLEESDHINTEPAGQIVRAKYLCMGCKEFERFFFIRLSDDGNSITKIGQYPPWDISGNEEIEGLLGRA